MCVGGGGGEGGDQCMEEPSETVGGGISMEETAETVEGGDQCMEEPTQTVGGGRGQCMEEPAETGRKISVWKSLLKQWGGRSVYGRAC